jgi:PAS domain S-box-containing protein
MTEDLLARILAPVAVEHVLESDNTLLVVAAPEGELQHVSPGALAVLGISPDDVDDCDLWELMPESDASVVRQMSAEKLSEGVVCPLSFVVHEDDCETFHCRLWMTDGVLAILGERMEEDAVRLRRQLIETNNELVVKSRELTRRTRELEHARNRLQETLDELETSYWHLKKIQEVLPICMECGKVKTSDADWEDVVEYLQRNALFLSHGYCPDCAEEMRAKYGIPHEEEEDAAEPR